ncbi:MAG: tetratricopeptide repeat protein [Steroidobacteraceae bacterium]
MRLADERDRAEVAAARAQEVSRFVGTLFEGASPYRTQGEVVSAVDLLRRGVKRADELDGEPEVQAELLRIIGRSLTALGDFDDAIPLLERALAQKRAAPVRDELSIAETLLALGEARRLKGDPAGAVVLIRESLEIRQRLLGDDDDATIVSLGRLGNVLFDLRQPEETLKYTRDALQRMVAKGQGESSAAIDMRGNIAIALDYLGRFDEAEALLRETIALSDRVDGELNPDTVVRMSNLALVLMRQGRLKESVAQFDATLDRARRALPPRHPQVVIALALQGAALKRLGQMDRAYRQYSEAADMVRDTEGERSAAYVSRLRGLANMRVEMARYHEAAATLRRALALSVELQGEDSPLVPPLRVLLAQALIGLGRPQDAEAELRAELALGERTSAGVTHVLNRELARAVGLQGRHAEAEPLMLAALAAQEASLSPDSPTLIPFLAATSAHYLRSGDAARALQYAERADAIRASAGDDAGWEVALALTEQGRALRALDRNAEAIPRWREAEAIMAGAFGEADPRVREIRRLLGRSGGAPVGE